MNPVRDKKLKIFADLRTSRISNGMNPVRDKRLKYLLAALPLIMLFIFPAPAHAARLWSSGAELQSEVDRVEADITGAMAISTAIKRSGAASLNFEITAASTGTYFNQLSSASDTDWDLYVRGYLYITSYTNDLDTILRLRDNPNTSNTAEIRMNSNGTLELWVNNSACSGQSQLGSDSAALSTGQWYRIEVQYTDVGSSYTVSARIDGVQFAGGTGTLGATCDDPNRTIFGIVTTSVANLYWDDIAVNDTSGSYQNSWPGSGRIIHMQPDGGAGDNKGASSGNCASVDEVTPDDATTIAVLDADADILDCTVESYTSAGLRYSDNINLVQVGVREAAAETGTESWQLRVKSASGGSVSSGTSQSHDDTTYRTNGDVNVSQRNYTLTSYTDPTTGNRWQPRGANSLDNMQIGIIATDAAPDINVSTLWALVEYTDGYPPLHPFMPF